MAEGRGFTPPGAEDWKRPQTDGQQVITQANLENRPGLETSNPERTEGLQRVDAMPTQTTADYDTTFWTPEKIKESIQHFFAKMDARSEVRWKEMEERVQVAVKEAEELKKINKEKMEVAVRERREKFEAQLTEEARYKEEVRWTLEAILEARNDDSQDSYQDVGTIIGKFIEDSSATEE